jgi:hypothetical protein
LIAPESALDQRDDHRSWSHATDTNLSTSASVTGRSRRRRVADRRPTFAVAQQNFMTFVQRDTEGEQEGNGIAADKRLPHVLRDIFATSNSDGAWCARCCRTRRVSGVWIASATRP